MKQISVFFQQAWDTVEILGDCKKPLDQYANKRSTIDAENFGPVNITAVCCRILEKLVRRHFLRFLKEQDVPFARGRRFISGTYTIFQILKMSNDCKLAQDTSIEVNISYKEVTKPSIAYLVEDWHTSSNKKALLSKPSNFLTHREQTVALNRVSTERKPAICDKPQNSVLGPILCIL